jgi:AcrR family transcriptional regulator
MGKDLMNSARARRGKASGGMGRRPARLSAVDRRRAILAAAKEIFLAEGYEGTTMRRIAEALGVTPTTLYLHFPDKSALLTEICDDSFAQLVVEFARADLEHAPPLEALRRLLDSYVGFGLAHPREYRLLFMTEVPPHVGGHRPVPGDGATRPDNGQIAFAALEALVRRLVDEGVFRPGDVETIAEAIWAAAHGLVSLLIAMPHFPWSERARLVDAIAEMVLRGWTRA